MYSIVNMEALLPASLPSCVAVLYLSGYPCCVDVAPLRVTRSRPASKLVRTDMPLALFRPAGSPAPLDQTCTFMLQITAL